MPSCSTITDIEIIDFPVRTSQEAALYIYEHNSHVPFLVSRVFCIDAAEACKRGEHAHKECQQILVCLRGEIELTVDDGNTKKTIIMSDPRIGVLITSGLWATQVYSVDSLLMVLTDKPYDEMDYIRDYDEFVKYKEK